MNHSVIHLVSMVGLGNETRESLATGGCPAWIESADRRCGKEATHGYLCSRHDSVARRRADKAAEKAAAARDRHDSEALRMLPKRRARLERVIAEIERRDPPPPTTDMAAFGGVGSTTARRWQARVMSDSNIRAMAALWDERRELEPLVAHGERVAAKRETSPEESR